ncbi:MAG TPA: Helicase associated domain protein, partial [Mycobacterium sp.]|uniref:DEAD/DEAH box helicase n=1 Tax=Mycobacterium sp. TaxID=1785 RepID=UPI002F411A5D
MATFSDLFARLDPDPRVRGKQFEHVCKWFLINDPTYKSTLRRVWLWSEWTGRWGGDAGIDLVAEDHDGRLWAIQAKAYAPENTITKADVDKFLAESSRAVFSYRLLIATTDKLHHVARRTINDQEKHVAFVGLSDLLTSEVSWRTNPFDIRPSPPPKPAKPRKDQRDAIRDVVKGFRRSDRGQLIMACGTGKTLTSLFIMEKLDAERVLVLVPSLSLLKQTMQVWRVNATTPFEALPVCSDETVGRSEEDAAVSHTSELGVPVTTDPADIAAFLRRRSGRRVVFSTYQSSPRVAEGFALGRVPTFDLVIADEAHRCAGSASTAFATVLDPSEIKAKRRLFMTATPRYFTGQVIKAAQEADLEIASMDDETEFGTVFYRLTFGEAIKRRLLTDYQVVVVGVDDATYLQWAEKGMVITRDGKRITDARTLAGQIGLAKAMRKYDLHRTISFHSRVARAREFASEMPEVIAWMPARQQPKGALWSRHASGEMSAGERHVLLQHLSRLDDGERGLLTNARCLSEGIDVPTLDGVAFIDPRRSEVDIVQAVGRAIRKSDDKDIGTIVIPVFIDADTDPESALDDSAFKPVWEVVKALRAHDEDLAEILDSLRRNLGKGGRLRLPGKIHLDLPTKVGVDFAKAFGVRLVEQTTGLWEFWYGLLERYVTENGTAQVNKGYELDGHQLGSWCANQRARHRRGELAADKVNRLDSLKGWVWDRHDSRWEAGFQHLLEYEDENGHALISSLEVFKGYPLGAWVAIQRRDGRSGKLSEERRDRLDSVSGWVWGLEDERWEKYFRLLQEYIAVHGNPHVTQTYTTDDGVRLGAWVNAQRARYNQKRLEPDRAERLAKLPDWVWKASEAKWDQGFQHLRNFAEAHGNVGVPIGYEIDGFKLRDWLTNNRAKFAKLTPDRQRRLKSLPGWDEYSQDVKWEAGFQRMLDYVSEHGDAKVERPYVVDDGYPLGSWVGTQRQQFKIGILAPGRAKRLAKLPGWRWEPRAGKWEEGFDHLVAYMKRNAGEFPPGDYVDDDDYRLGAWVHMQRNLNRKG